MASKSLVLVTIILMDLLTGMEFDLFVPSFPELQQDFQLSPFWVEALLSINFIGYCVSLFFVGGLSDRYGRKPILILGLLIFVVGSALCLWGNSYSLLFIGRFLQGLGIAAPSILSFLIIADTYSMEQQRFWLAMLNGAMNTATAIAPVIGSYITWYFHWRGNFFALLSLGLIVLMMTTILVPSYQISKTQKSESLQGYLTVLSCLPLLLLITHIAIMFVPYWIFVGMSPLLYMENLGVSLTHFGYYQGVLALVFAVGSIGFGFLVNRYEPKKLLQMTNTIFIISIICIILVIMFAGYSPLLITIAFLIFVIGQIIPTTILYPLCINYIPEAKGRIAALIQGGRLILAALGLQIAGYFYQGTFFHVGVILIIYILLAVVTLYLVLQNRQLLKKQA